MKHLSLFNVLTAHADEEGRVVISTGRLARTLGTSARTIYRHLSELEEAGAIARDREFDTATITRTIWINPDAAVELAAVEA